MGLDRGEKKQRGVYRSLKTAFRFPEARRSKRNKGGVRGVADWSGRGEGGGRTAPKRRNGVRSHISPRDRSAGERRREPLGGIVLMKGRWRGEVKKKRNTKKRKNVDAQKRLKTRVHICQIGPIADGKSTQRD